MIMVCDATHKRSPGLESCRPCGTSAVPVNTLNSSVFPCSIIIKSRSMLSLYPAILLLAHPTIQLAVSAIMVSTGKRCVDQREKCVANAMGSHFHVGRIWGCYGTMDVLI